MGNDRQAEPGTAPNPQHVLVVDDDFEIRETLRILLEDAGYEVSEADDGGSALILLRDSSHPLVTLVDLVMPEPDGEALLRAVRDDASLSGRHAYVLVTASTTRFSPALKGLLAQLSTPVVQKPFDIDHLLDVVVSAIGRLPSGASRDGPHGAV